MFLQQVKGGESLFLAISGNMIHSKLRANPLRHLNENLFPYLLVFLLLYFPGIL
jgi:hypothetical protein